MFDALLRVKSLRYQRNLYIAEKYIYWATIPSLTIRVYLHSFSRYCLRNTRNIAKFQDNSKSIWPYSSSRSSKVIDLGVNGKPICDFILAINSNFSRISATVFEIFTIKDRKLLILPTPHMFDTPSGGTPWDIDVILYVAAIRAGWCLATCCLNRYFLSYM